MIRAVVGALVALALAASPAHAANGATFTPHALTPAATAGVEFPLDRMNPVGNFTAVHENFDDNPISNPCGCYASFPVTIDWGDGTTPSAGKVFVGTSNFPSDPNLSSYNVAGAHTYATAGSYRVSMKVTHGNDAANSGTTESTITVTGYQVPTVTNQPPTDVTSRSATIHGLVNPNNAATFVTVTLMPFRSLTAASSFDTRNPSWGTVTDYLATNFTRTVVQDLPVGSGATAVPLNLPVTNMLPNTRYRVIIAAKSNGPTGVQTVTTPGGTPANFNIPGPPEPVPGSSEPVGPTDSAYPTAQRIRGTVNANGAPTDAYFEYGTTTSYGSKTDVVHLLRQGSDAFHSDCETGFCAHYPASLYPQDVAARITDLAPHTVYHYRIVATSRTDDGFGTRIDNLVRSADQTFTSSSDPEAAVVKPTTAPGTGGNIKLRLTGTVKQFGTDAHFQWQYGVADNALPEHIDQSDVEDFIDAKTAETPVTRTIQVSPRVPYLIRLATWRTGGSVHYSPTVTTCAGQVATCVNRSSSLLESVTGIGTRTATANAWTPNESNTVVNPGTHGIPSFIQWCQTDAANQCTTATSTSAGFRPAALNGVSLFKTSKPLTGLLPSRTYKTWVRTEPDTGSVHSNDFAFKTDDAILAPVGTAATLIGTKSATLNATIDAPYEGMTLSFLRGDGAATSTGEVETARVPIPYDPDHPQHISLRVTGLVPGHVYHYRPIVHSALGILQLPQTNIVFQTTGAENPPPVIAGCQRTATQGLARLQLPANTATTVCFSTAGNVTTAPYGQPVYVNGIVLTPNPGVRISASTARVTAEGGDQKASITVPCDVCFATAQGGGSIQFPAQAITWSTNATSFGKATLQLDPSIVAGALNEPLLTADDNSQIGGFKLSSGLIVLYAGGVAETAVVAKAPFFDIATAPVVSVVDSSSSGDTTWDGTATLKDSFDLNAGGVGLLRVNPFSAKFTADIDPRKDDTWYSSTNLDLILLNVDGAASFQHGQTTQLGARVDASAQEPLTAFVNGIKKDTLTRYGIVLGPDLWLQQLDIGFLHPQPYDFNGVDPNSCTGANELNDRILSKQDVTLAPGQSISYGGQTCVGKRLHVAPPFVGRGSGSIAIGPLVNGKPETNVSGTVQYSSPEYDSLKSQGWGFRVAGVVSVGGDSISLSKPATADPNAAPLFPGNPTTGTAPAGYNPVTGKGASAFLEYVNGDHILFGGGLSQSFPKEGKLADLITIAADGQGIIQLRDGVTGNVLSTPLLAVTLVGNACINVPGLNVSACAKAGVGVSNNGLGACVGFQVPGLSVAGTQVWPPVDYSVGAAVFFADGSVSYISTCSHDGLRSLLGFDKSVFASALRPRSFDVPIDSARPDELIKVVGSTAPPIVKVIGPDNRTVTTDQPGHADAEFFYYKDPNTATTWVDIPHPAVGTYHFEGVAGSAAITHVETASGIAAPSVKASVAGAGHHRFIDYQIRKLPNQTVRFVEHGANGQTQIIGSVNGGGTGRLAFFPGDGLAGTRTIEALVLSGGLQRAAFKVASYTAPANFKPATPKLTTQLANDRLKVTWTRVARAERYQLRITTGKTTVSRSYGPAKRRSVTVPIAPGATARVRLAAADHALNTSRPALKVVRNALCAASHLSSVHGHAAPLAARCQRRSTRPTT